MNLQNVLLVTRNYQGICEENFLSTIDEFVDEYCSSDFNGIFNIDALKSVISGAEPFKWDGNYYAWGNDSYDMRLCQGPEDLLSFLSGKYNDSLEAMESRNPGSAGLYDFWYWENKADKFSVLSVEAVAEYTHTAGAEFFNQLLSAMPNFPFEKAPPKERHTALSDVIRNAEESRFHEKTKNVVLPGYDR